MTLFKLKHTAFCEAAGIFVDFVVVRCVIYGHVDGAERRALSHFWRIFGEESDAFGEEIKRFLRVRGARSIPKRHTHIQL